MGKIVIICALTSSYPALRLSLEINQRFDIENILQVNSENQNYEGNSKSNNSLEESILEKIKQD